jgi:hypothetical protein
LFIQKYAGEKQETPKQKQGLKIKLQKHKGEKNDVPNNNFGLPNH